jgi:excisionase family DNA binding protein
MRLFLLKGVENMAKKNASVYESLFKEYPDVLSIEQMAEMIGVSTKTAYKVVNDGKVDCIKVGRAYKIPKVNVMKYLKVSNI